MKSVLVAGAGAIGSFLAARFLGTATKMTILARGERLRELRQQGIAIALGEHVTYAVGEDIKQGRLRTVLAKYEFEPLGLHAVYPHSRYLAAKVRSFVDFAALKFQSPSWDDFAD